MADEKPPRVAGDERAILTSLLAYQRSSLVKKLDGVDDTQAAASPVGSGTSLLWLINHMADAEATWVLRRFAGQRTPAQFCRLTRERDLAARQHVHHLREPQHLGEVLVDEQHRGAGASKIRDDVEELQSEIDALGFTGVKTLRGRIVPHGFRYAGRGSSPGFIFERYVSEVPRTLSVGALSRIRLQPAHSPTILQLPR